MRPRAINLVLLALSYALACGVPSAVSTAPVAQAPARTAQPAPMSARDAPPLAEAGVTNASVEGLPRLLAEIRRQEDRARDPNRLFQAFPQTRPIGFHGIPPTRPGPFPGTRFATVAGFSFNFARDLVPDACDIVATDGTLCPGVNAPGVVLGAEQASRLLRVIQEAGTRNDASIQVGRPVLRCFDPHLAFLFFDEGLRPVGELEVCLDCNGWRATPDVPGLFGAMRPEEWMSIVALCEDLGLDGCWRGDPRFKPAESVLENAPSTSTQGDLDDLGPAVDLEGSVGATSLFERRALCAHSLRAHRWDARYGGGLRTQDGRSWQILDYQTCVSHFPSCPARVRDALACERWLAPTTAAQTSATSRSPCSGVDDCLWALRVEPVRP